jgi:ABC-2 type transport system permease protein
MNGLQLLAHQTRYEQKAFWRNPVAGVFIVAFPLLFLVIFAGGSGHVSAYDGIRAAQYVVPQMLAYGLMNACFTNPAIALVLRRENGLLKRMRLMPVPSWAVFGGVVGNSLVTAVLIGAVVLVVGGVGYSITFPGHYLALLVAFVVGVATFTALGIAVSTFVPNEDAGAPIVNLVYLGLLFLSGTFIPIRPGSTLANVGNIFPIRHLSTAMLDAFLPFGPHGPTHGFAWSDIGVLALWGLGAGAVAIRRWRWEPRR